MKALLLAAGFGTRLKPLTNNIPKCLVPIGGKPLLQHWLESLQRAGVSKVYINTHFHADKVSAFLSGYKTTIEIEQLYEPELLGTAGTLLKNAQHFSGAPFLLAHADNFSICDLEAFIGAHYERPKSDVTKITMMTFVCDDPSSCGVVKQDSQGVITEYYEKVSNPPSDNANAAVFMVEPFVLEFMKTKTPGAFDFCADVIPHFIGRMFGWANDVYHKDIGTIETYREALTDFETLTRQKNAE